MRVRKIRFFELSRPSQERFIASAKGTAPPAPIVRRLGTTRSSAVHAAVAGGAAVLALVLVVAGYGSLGSAWSVQPAWVLLAYAGVFFLLPYGAMRALALYLAAKSLPFRPGVYVFPMCGVDARTKCLRVAPMSDVVRVEHSTGGSAFRVTYKGLGTFEFPPPGAQLQDQLKFQFENAQEQANHALASGDEAELVTIDPFYEPKKWTNPIGPEARLVERVPAWAKLAWAFALGLSVVLTPCVWLVRNAASDDVTFERAKKDGSVQAFRAYLAFGTRHSSDVRRIFLPRAELGIAKRQGTVEAAQDFLRTHPGSAIDPEAQAALQGALAGELEKAKTLGTVSALEQFEAKYPAHHLDAELGQARHALFVGALATFKKAAPGAGPDARAVYDALFAWVERHGPRLFVVVEREISRNLAQADKLVGSSPLNRALGPAQVTRYFPADRPQPKEAEVVAGLASSLAKVVPADMLRVESLAAPPPDANEEAILGAARAPVLVVRYRIGWRGAAFTSKPLKRVFAGIVVTGDAVLRVPGSPLALRANLDVPPPRALLLGYDAPAHAAFGTAAPAGDGPPEPAIYAAQEMRALDRVTTTLERLVLPPR